MEGPWMKLHQWTNPKGWDTQENNILTEMQLDLHQTSISPWKGPAELYLVFDWGYVALFPVIDSIWNFFLPVGNVKSLVILDTRWRDFKPHHLLNNLLAGLQVGKRERERKGEMAKQNMGHWSLIKLESSSWGFYTRGHKMSFSKLFPKPP